MSSSFLRGTLGSEESDSQHLPAGVGPSTGFTVSEVAKAVVPSE
jgi:hypothetical protein